MVRSSKSNSLSINRAFVCQTFYEESKTLLAGVTMKERLRRAGVLGFHVCHPFSLNKLECDRFVGCYRITIVNDFKLAHSPLCPEPRCLNMHNTAKWISTRDLNELRNTYLFSFIRFSKEKQRKRLKIGGNTLLHVGLQVLVFSPLSSLTSASLWVPYFFYLIMR